MAFHNRVYRSCISYGNVRVILDSGILGLGHDRWEIVLVKNVQDSINHKWDRGQIPRGLLKKPILLSFRSGVHDLTHP